MAWIENYYRGLLKNFNVCANSHMMMDQGELITKIKPTVTSHVNLQNKSFKPNIVKLSRNQTAIVGENVIVRVHFTPLTPVQIKWFKNNKELSSSNDILIQNEDGKSTLIIDKVMDIHKGKYIIEVSNEFGSDRKFTSITVKGPPEPPAGIPSVLINNDNSMTMFWSGTTYDGGSAIVGYQIEMQQNSSEWKIVDKLCKNNSFTINNLTINDDYSFRVCAVNDIGISRPGKESKIIKLQNIKNYDADLRVQNNVVTIEKIDSLSSLYEIKEEVGRGRFGVCKRVIEISTSKEKAGKIIRCLRNKDKEEVYREASIMNKLRHARLIQLEAAYELTKEIVLITEFISGGELFERVVDDDYVLTELECVLFMRQICDGVCYLHNNKIMHLDLKPENILCKTRTSYEIKIIDFGLARIYNPDEPIKILFGTPEFVAPEIIQYEPICLKTDMWSLGVICYVLLSGLSPFLGNNDPETFSNVTQAEYDFDDEVFENISEKAKNFISQLLHKRPEKRMSAEECLKHPWLSLNDEPINHIQLPTDKLKKFLIRRKWQKTATAIRALGRITNLGINRKNV